tara:strand:+ start:573 stop:794 length:222 start_codon:yes stop_codon:yes gene_type:complete
MVEWKMEKYFAEYEKDDFIGVYHPFPHERKLELKKDDPNQLDLFKDYCPPKESWWRRIMRKVNKKFLGIKLFF